MKQAKHCDLKTCFMCRHAMDAWVPFIGSRRQNIQLKKGKRFIQEGDPVTGIYFVCEGKVKVHKQWDDKEIIVRFAHKGAIVGHRGLATRGNVFPISATTLEPCLVCFVELDFFISTLKVNADLTYQLMMFYADEFRESEQRMHNLVHMTVKNRLALAIMKLAEEFGTTNSGFIDIQLSKQDLASYVGTTYETLFRMLNELIREKLIVVDGKQIRIENPATLSALATTHVR